jgi:sporulation protein YlmC with PRC-barrel domain
VISLAGTIPMMMRLSGQFNQLPVFSLHAGHPIGQINGLLIDPHKLHIAGLWTSVSRDGSARILLPQHIRELQGAKGLVIDHEDDLSMPDELIRLKEIIDIEYQLIGKKIMTVSKQHLGKVVDFVVDDLNWQITKLHGERPAWKMFLSNAFIIDRGAVHSVNDRAIVVRDGIVPVKSTKKLAPLPEPTLAA